MTTEIFAIESGVDVPKKQGNQRYPFGEMKVGDSFFATDGKATAAAHAFGGRVGKKFATRREGSGVRIWRIK